MMLLLLTTNMHYSVIKICTGHYSLVLFVGLVLASLTQISCIPKSDRKVIDQFAPTFSPSNDLKFGIYITAHAVRDLLHDETGRRQALSIFQSNGISKAYIEVYR